MYTCIYSVVQCPRKANWIFFFTFQSPFGADLKTKKKKKFNQSINSEVIRFENKRILSLRKQQNLHRKENAFGGKE